MKVLVIRFSSIGDIVLTTPVLRCLKKQLENVEIHYCTKLSYRTLLESNPYINKFHYLGESLFELGKALRKEKFDLVIDLHKNTRTLFLKLMIGAPSSSFNKLNWEKWLLVNFKLNKLPSVHIVDRYMKTLEGVGIVNDGLGLDYFFPANEAFAISQLPASFQKGFIIYAIGGQHETKKLPLEKMKELMASISVPLILIGGKEDEATGEKLAEIAQEKKPVLNLCGKLSLHQSASLIEKSLKVYSHDTGMMHIAAAFKKEIVVIWGNTVPDFGMYPYATKFTSLQVEDLSCRPCSKIGFSKCPKKHFHCMNMQQFESISG
jgi:heptosyltransferase-2